MTEIAQYNLAASDWIPIKIAASQRRRMYEKLFSTNEIQVHDAVLDLGVTSDWKYSHPNGLNPHLPTSIESPLVAGLMLRFTTKCVRACALSLPMTRILPLRGENPKLPSAKYLSELAAEAGLGNFRVTSLKLDGWPCGLLLSTRCAI